MATSSSSSEPNARNRPCALLLNGGGDDGQPAVTNSSVDRLLADIAFQRDRERERLKSAGRGRQRNRHRGGGKCRGTTTAAGCGMEPVSRFDDDEAASAYWWTDLFLRHFVFDDDRGVKTAAAAADADDLLFFVRRRKNKRKSKRNHHGQSLQLRRQVAYDTRAYRKQQHRQPTLLPIGDPTVLWRHTVCLNAIIHRLRYTLTVAVCARVPRKSGAPAAYGIDHYHHSINYWNPYAGEQTEFYDNDDDGHDDDDDDDRCDDREYDLQLLSRYVHTVYASTSGRRMDAAKGPRERLVYPAICWAADDYAEAFRTVVVHPGQTVCTELVAAWPSTTVIEDYADDGIEVEYNQGSDEYGRVCHGKSIKLQQKQNRVVLFAGAIPYAAVRATYECKMSLYREAERQRKRNRRKRNGGKKSSLCAALSASLTALITGGKDSVPQGSSSDYGDYDYNNDGGGAPGADRVEYVTVRGCRPGCWAGDGRECDLSQDDENNCSCDGLDFDDAYGGTKGLAQMAVALAAVQPSVTGTTGAGHREDISGEYQHRQYCGGTGGEDDDGGDAGYAYYDDADDHYRHPNQLQADYASSPYAGGVTTSEPGDFYDYGWDYETTTAASGSGQQTPQTPSYQQQQQQQLDRRRRRLGGRPRRLSDPCSISVFDLPDRDDEDRQQSYQQHQQLHYNLATSVYGTRRNYRKQQHGYNCSQHEPSGYSGIAAVVTPGRSQQPHRAWSESDGLDRCDGGGWSYSGSGVPVKQQRTRQKRPLIAPPPPVPYYCAAEAAASGFVQYVRKSPGGWWTRRRHQRQSKRTKNKSKVSQRQQRNNVTAVAVTTTQRRRRSISAGGNASHSGCCNTTDDECNSIDGSDSCSDPGDDGGSDSNSDDQDSDGEFIGALSAAATVGNDPDREWNRQRSSGDPVADWERYDSDSDSADDHGDDDDDLVEWTNEIVATDLRRKRLFRSGSISIAPPPSRLLGNEYNFCGKPPPQIPAPAVPVDRNPKQQQQNFNATNHRRRRQPPPQLRPQPLEPPPPPPALSVAFTAVACPWWTVLEDVLVTNTTTSDKLSSSNKSIMGLPLLTFD